MATNKTIDITGQTVTIPAMSDKPDQSKNSDGTSKLVDAANSLNDAIAKLVLEATSAVTLNSTSGNWSSGIALTGLTAKHELVRWNFSSSAENNPPVNIEWKTEAGYWYYKTTTASTETIKPVFALP